MSVHFHLVCLLTLWLGVTDRGITIAGESPHAASPDQISVSGQRIAEALVSDPMPSPGQVVVVYFTPNDREPAKNHLERIRRITETTASFYRDELRRHGFGNRVMNVLRDEDERVRVIDVVGQLPDREYGKPDGTKIRAEILPVLKSQGINPSSSVLLMFCNLMDYDAEASTISHHSPYYGGGSHLSGNAWQCDSEILDPLRLTDPTPLKDGEYGRITIGKHNSIFIGGVIHELGHALSLPHCRQRQDESVRGTALMGSGNRTFGDELRGDGRGTFLTQAHAMRLAAHPAFNPMVPLSIITQARTRWSDLRIATADDSQIRISGSVESEIPIHGMVAYFDPEGGGDYDATTATAVPNDAGEFVLQSGDLRVKRSGQLRLLTCHVNGTTTTRRFTYKVDNKGRPDLSLARLELELGPMIDSIRKADLDQAAQELAKSSQGDPELASIGRRVLERFLEGRNGPSAASVDLNEIEDSVVEIPLSATKPEQATVGWDRVSYDGIPNRDRLLSVEGDYFARGLYAHAPARHQYRLNGRWKRLAGRCGMQTGNFGKVDFEIIGDGRRLWSHRGVVDGESIPFSVDIQGVQTLQLVVTDGGNGKGGDWGIWIEPTLSR